MAQPPHYIDVDGVFIEPNPVVDFYQTERPVTNKNETEEEGRNAMKFGIRTPSLKKSLKARTTGKLKRKVKKAINPFYGKKGMGWLRPRKKLYNKVYKKTTFSIFDLFK